MIHRKLTSNIYATHESSSLRVSRLPLYVSPFSLASFFDRRRKVATCWRVSKRANLSGRHDQKRERVRVRTRGLSKRKIVGAVVTCPAHWARTGTKGSCPATWVRGSIKPWAKFRRRIPRVCVDEGTRLTIANNLCPILETSCKCLLTERTSPLYSLLGK